jgi:phosphoenolpyruvate-protein kinase (PTS system EI component)
MSASAIPVIKAVVRRLQIDECRRLHERVRRLSTAAAIEQVVRAWSAERFPELFAHGRPVDTTMAVE